MAQLSVELPEYDESVFGAKRAELAKYFITVPHDVVALGYAGINKLYSDLQVMLNRVDEMLAEADSLVAQAETVYNACQYAYEAKMDAKLASLAKDQYESIKIVEAKARFELKDDIKLMQRAKLTVGLLKAYRKTVQGKHKSLESSKKTLENQNNNLKRQMPPSLPQ